MGIIQLNLEDGCRKRGNTAVFNSILETLDLEEPGRQHETGDIDLQVAGHINIHPGIDLLKTGNKAVCRKLIPIQPGFDSACVSIWYVVQEDEIPNHEFKR